MQEVSGSIPLSSTKHSLCLVDYHEHSTRCGAIAQLGERLHGMQEVSGSIPLSSTKSSHYFLFHPVFQFLLIQLTFFVCLMRLSAIPCKGFFVNDSWLPSFFEDNQTVIA